MKSHDRAKSDAQHEAALKKFRQSCSQTGGGTGSEPPPGKGAVQSSLPVVASVVIFLVLNNWQRTR